MSERAAAHLTSQMMKLGMRENASNATLQDNDSINTLTSRGGKNSVSRDTEPRDMRETLSTGGESPDLLATSVGVDSQGNLITSASNISLLSLNQQVGTISATSGSFQRNLNQHRLPLLQTSSSSSIPQQGQAYRKYSFTSPKGTTRTTQPVAILAAPDSPSLIPTSLAASPSNFNLNQSSPPNSFKSRSSSYLAGSSFRLNNRFTPHYPLTRTDSIPNSIGGRSPEFLPSSLNMPPMTPLNLSVPFASDESPFENESDQISQVSVKSIKSADKSPKVYHSEGPVFAEQIQDSDL
ncbi:hypothetical protein OGAPHI_006175 [Ogataea philodendri]|uniref:Uncharacterized protein n=1 Tax=Ogataea philodendri TaxID=1378263 RepID=A0A9P8NZN9_9ASCO|nr:uncharacterized protein OGAPHI_006175 [Ogataea philodendri]KAH3661994.1 hypothetical protein OGAPHI_006175 [Ogataea philodendri]